MSEQDLLSTYDAEVRDTFADRVPTGWTSSTDGPLVRCLTPHGGFALASSTIGTLTDEALSSLVERTVAFYADHGRSFEWKTFDHDPPALVPLLDHHGFVAEDHESLVLGPVEALAAAPELAPGLVLRAVRERGDLERIAALESHVWGEDWSWLADDLAGRVDDPREPALVYVVEDPAAAPAPGLVVSAAWLVPLAGTRVAGLWGGSTLPGYRRRGIYRALVAARAQEAQRRGFQVLQVDASEDSRPVLERLGLHTVGGTTPYRWTPPT